MKAVLVPVGKAPIEVEVDGLKDLQKAVGGYIEPCSWIFDDQPAVYVNEEGKYTCKANRAYYATRNGFAWDGTPIRKGQLLDVIYGDFICIGCDPETGDSRDITPEEVKRVMDMFGTEKSISNGLVEFLRAVSS